MEVKNCAKALELMPMYPTHTHHKSFEIIYQVEGHCTLTANGKSFPVNQGDVIILPPGIAHSGNGDGGVFKDMYIQCIGCEFTDVYVVHDTDDAMLSLMEMIYRLTTEKGDRYHEIADSLLEAICAYLTKYINKKTKYEFVDSFKNLMYENLSNHEFNISEGAMKSGYTQDYFRRCFKEETGMTPLEYLTALRLNRAKKLLRATPYQSIDSIAAGCGFSDVFYFSRVFKKHLGVSTREYRKSHSI